MDDPVAASVLRYFVHNPRCIDDLEGIARWRLLEEQVEQVVSETALALDRLVGAGLLVRIDAPGLRQRYRLRAGRIDGLAAEMGSPAAPTSARRRPARRPPR